MTKYCPACGAQAIEEAIFCQRCGQKLEGASAATAADRDGPAPQDQTPAERLRSAVAAPDDDEPEQTLWEGGYCGKAMIGPWIAAGLLTLAGALLGFWQFGTWKGLLTTLACAAVFFGSLGVYFAYRKLSVWYVLTNHWFIHKSGILRRITDRIEIIDVDDVTFEQGLVERFVGVGTIKVVSSDRSHPELHLRGIDHVKSVAKMLDDIRRKERRRRGLHIENV